jgi:predicted PurR-regulated permease PerM
MFRFQDFKSLFPYFLLAAAVIAAYYAIGEIRTMLEFIGGIFLWIWNVITPFFYGFVIAYILHIPFDALQKLIGENKWKFIAKRKKLFSLIIVLIVFALVVFAISYLVIPAVYNSILHFIEELPYYYDSALVWLENLNNTELVSFDLSMDGIIEMAEELLQNFSLEYLSSSVNALRGISSAIFGVGTAIFTGFLAFISSMFFLMEKDKIKYFICRLLVMLTPAKFHETAMKYGGKLDKNCKQYIKIQTIDGLILGSLATIELLIMRSPYAIVLGIMLGIVNYIPYFGSIFGTIVAVIIVAFTQGLTMGLIALAVLLVTQQIDANIIQPKLMGGSFKLSPLLVIVSITVGGAISGVFGMIIAIPIIGVLKDVFEDVVKNYEHHKHNRSEKEKEKIKNDPP